MLLVILVYDQLLFRPLVAWSAKFRFETTAGATATDPWLLRLMRRTRLLSLLGDTVGDAADGTRRPAAAAAAGGADRSPMSDRRDWWMRYGWRCSPLLVVWRLIESSISSPAS